MNRRTSHARGARLVGVLGLGLLVLTAIACKEEAPPPVESIRPVRIMNIGDATTGGTREYPGRIKAGQYSEMSFEVPGRVTEFVFTEGSAVDIGAVLARLDPADYQTRYDSALARREQARAERDRYKAMYEKDVKPFAEYEMRLKRWEVKVAEATEAEKALNDTVLRAPFAGVMARKLVEEHENVLAKAPVLIMQNDDMLEIKVNVPERDLAEADPADISRGDLDKILNPRVVVSSLPGRAYPARIKELAAVADPATRTFEATFSFENPEGVSILGGMTAKVVLDRAKSTSLEGILIPANAVLSDGGQSSVWVIDGETMTARRREIEVGELKHDLIAVTAGLDSGDRIATSGVHQLRDGQVVRLYEN